MAAELAFAHKGGTVSGNAVILGSLSVSGAMSAATTLSVSGAAVMKTTLNVEGNTTLSGNCTILGTLTTGGIFPVGAVIPYAGTAAPVRFLLCDGAAYTATGSYSVLFGVIGYAFGIGAGETSTLSTILFQVPDLRGRVPVGLDNLGGTSANRVTGAWADVLGSASGSEAVVLTVNEMPAHNHDIQAITGNGGGNVGLSNDGTSAAADNSTAVRSKGGGAAHNNLPPSLALGYIIRAT